MKILLLTMSAAALAIAGCDTVAPERIDPSAKHPDARTGEVQNTGTLYVQGLGPIAPGETTEGGKLPTPTMFSVYDANGNLVTSTRANSVDLPPGRYLVRPEHVYEDEHDPFWVTVEAGKQTVVDAQQMQDEHRRMNVR